MTLLKKEIVFGPSVQGSLRMAQFTGVGPFPKAFICTVKDKNGNIPDAIKRLNEKNEKKWYNSRPIGGNAKDIICLEMALEYGDISGRIPGKQREQVIYQLTSSLYQTSKGEDTTDEWAKSIIRNNKIYMKALREAMKNGDEIRIWYSSSPSELNGFYWLMNFFDKNKYYQNVSTVFLPPDYWNGEYYCNAWGQMPPEKYFDALCLEKPITEKQIKDCSDKWNKLRSENLPLRLLVSGNLVSLHEEFIDGFIRDCIEKMPDKFRIAHLVGNVMGECGLMLSDAILFHRVRSMIVSGELMLAEEWQEQPMSTLVKRK